MNAAERMSLLPNLIAEVVLYDDDADLIAKALSDDDLAEVGRLFKAARDRYVYELIANRNMVMRDSLTDEESAEALCESYQ